MRLWSLGTALVLWFSGTDKEISRVVILVGKGRIIQRKICPRNSFFTFFFVLFFLSFFLMKRKNLDKSDELPKGEKCGGAGS